jgi:hypothetical protein
VGGGTGGSIVQPLSVQGQTKGSLDSRSKSLGVRRSEDTGVVNLDLDGGGVVEVDLGSDLEGDTTGGRLGIVNGLGTGLDVLGDLVVVGCREGAEVSETVDGDGVVGGRVADGSGVSGDGTGQDVVGGFGTDKGAVSTENNVRGESGTLRASEASACRITLNKSTVARVCNEGCL